MRAGRCHPGRLRVDVDCDLCTSTPPVPLPPWNPVSLVVLPPPLWIYAGVEEGGGAGIPKLWKENKAPEVAWRRAPTARITTPSIYPPNLLFSCTTIEAKLMWERNKKEETHPITRTLAPPHKGNIGAHEVGWEKAAAEAASGISPPLYPRLPLPFFFQGSPLCLAPAIPRVPRYFHCSSPPPISCSFSRFPALWRGWSVSRRESTPLGNVICEEMNRGVLPSTPTRIKNRAKRGLGLGAIE